VTVAEGWQRVVEKLHSSIDRLTHTRDRRRAAVRVRRRGPPKRIVIVCYGNICRSPYAAAYLRRKLELIGVHGIEVESAGFIGPDRRANNQAASIALERGLDLSNHRSRLFQRTDAERADLVLAMTRTQRELLIQQFGVTRGQVELVGDFDVEDPPYREILDPYGRSDEEFRRVFLQIERSIEGVCASWA
jgi:protein-tyrosine phosphatase